MLFDIAGGVHTLTSRIARVHRSVYIKGDVSRPWRRAGLPLRGGSYSVGDGRLNRGGGCCRPALMVPLMAQHGTPERSEAESAFDDFTAHLALSRGGRSKFVFHLNNPPN